MNYKFSDNLSSKYVVLSYFHQGLFWGIILAWISLISGVSGAVTTKFLYLDRRKTIVVQNSATIKESLLLESVEETTVSKANDNFLAFSYWQNSTVNSLDSNEFKFALTNPNPLASRFLNSFNYHSADNILFANSFNSIFLSRITGDSIISDINSTLDNEKYDRFKNFKIIIQNTTDSFNLEKQVSDYLKERGFNNIELTNNNSRYLSKTAIVTESQNLAAADYLKTTLSFGTLNLSDNHSSDEYAESKLLIQLGGDAKYFAKNQTFIY